MQGGARSRAKRTGSGTRLRSQENLRTADGLHSAPDLRLADGAQDLTKALSSGFRRYDSGVLNHKHDGPLGCMPMNEPQTLSRSHLPTPAESATMQGCLEHPVLW